MNGPRANSQVFEVTGPDGLIRRGILTMPAGAPLAAVIFLPAGLKYRVGPGRLYFTLARDLAAAGVASLRYDPRDIGESDGALERAPIHQLWLTIEHGRFVGDTVLAAEALRERMGAGVPIYLAGLCGGGLTAAAAAMTMKTHPPAGLVSFNVASTFSIGPGRRAPALSASETRFNASSYVTKLISREAWRRLVTGVSNYRAIGLTIRSAMSRTKATAEASGLNPLFQKSFRDALRRRIPHLLIFGETDSRWLQFKDLVLAPELRDATDGPAHRVLVIPHANHELHRREWRAAAVKAILTLMTRAESLGPNTTR